MERFNPWWQDEEDEHVANWGKKEVKWGLKTWKKPSHLKDATLLTKDLIPLFLGTYNF